MRTFRLIRTVDVTGISGTGVVAEGVIFQDGETVVRWLSITPSTNIYKNIEEVLKVHGHGDATSVEFLT